MNEERDAADEPPAVDFGVDSALALARVRKSLLGRKSHPPAIGRYRVVRQLGKGAMGKVYAAHDDALDRDVAVKILQHERLESHDHARFLREAQTLAQLAHPNVVEVFEVGESDGKLFLAMELVRGPNLREWLADSPRPEEILHIFRQAAAGLYAAHQAGVVHRDFKPENVVIGADGRAKIIDFGLAMKEQDSTNETPASSWSSSGGARLTHTGTVMGTPVYMAPEQHIGSEPDPASDQFAFCVALFEALYGKRPFAGESLEELALAKSVGQIEPTPGKTTAGRRVRAVVRKGLARKPSLRFPSMRALLEALDHAATPRRFPWLVTLGSAGAVSLLVALFVAGERSEGVDDCDAGDLAEIWDDSRKLAVKKALEASGSTQASETWVRVEHRLDERAETWRRAQAQACSAVPGAQASAELECLSRLRDAFATTVRLLAEGGPELVERAVAQASSLRPATQCAAAAISTDVAPPDPAVASQVQQVRRELDRGEVMFDAGRFEEALPLVEAAVRDAERLGYAPAHAEALVRLAAVRASVSNSDEAVELLEQAQQVASSCGYDEVAADAAIRLVYEVGYMRGRVDDGLRHARDADAALQRWDAVGDKHELAEAQLRSNLGVLYDELGEYDKAREAFESALEVKGRVLGADHPEYAGALQDVALALAASGRLAEALPRMEESDALFREIQGDRHPDVARSAMNLGSLVGDLGQERRAEELFEQARSIYVEVYGEKSIDVAFALDQIGVTAAMQGRYAEALKLHEQALDIVKQTVGPNSHESIGILGNLAESYAAFGRLEEGLRAISQSEEVARRVYGSEHPQTATIMTSKAKILADLGRLEEAQTVLEDAVATHVRVLGEEHIETGESQLMLGRLYSMRGNPSEALALHRKALRVAEQEFGPEHAEVGWILLEIGEVELEMDRPPDALGHLQRSIAILEEADAEPAYLASARFALAQAIARTGGDMKRARDLARSARRTFVEGGPVTSEERRDVDRWLAKH